MLATSSSPKSWIYKEYTYVRLKNVTLFWKGEDPDVIEVFESVGEQVGGDSGAVRPLQVELLQVGAVVEAADGWHEHPVIVPLGPEPLDVLGEEESDVLHQLLAREVVVSGHLQGAEHLV